jgi:hypothetical protein
MNAVLVENMPSIITQKFWNKINYDILYTYIKSEKKEKKDIEDMSLLEYINSDSYKNDDWKYYNNAEDFLSDLKKWK